MMKNAPENVNEGEGEAGGAGYEMKCLLSMSKHVCSDRQSMLAVKDTKYVNKPFRDSLQHKEEKEKWKKKKGKADMPLTC